MRIEFTFEYHQILFHYFNSISPVDIEKERHVISAKVINKHIEKYTESISEGINGEEFLLELQKKIENEMAAIISRRSVYYWMHLYRRIGVIKSFGETETTLSLYR